MDLATRHEQVRLIHDRVLVSLTAELTNILLTTLSSAATDQDKRRLRAKQVWARGQLGNDRLSHLVAAMIAAAAPDDTIDNGLMDAEINNMVTIAVNALAAVEYEAPDATVPE